jgi:hypothetical protein
LDEKRRPRTKKRMTCGLSIEGRHYSGFVLDISRLGLYVQTSARPAQGTAVEVELSLPTRKQPVHMRAKVARQKLVPPELRSIAKGGIGLHIDDPPEAYKEYHASVAPPDQDPETGAEFGAAGKVAKGRRPRDEGGASPRYRVRLGQISGPRSRTITVACETLEEAKRKALAEVGEDWKVLSADPV